MKRALHIVDAYLSNDARVKSYISILIQQGWTVDVICCREAGRPEKEEKEGYRIFRVADKYQGTNPLKYLYAYLRFFINAKRVAKIMHEHEPYELVHVHNMPNFLIGAVKDLLPKPNLVLDMHDLMSVTFKAKFGNSNIPMKLIHLEEKWSIGRADHLICADAGQSEILKKTHPGVEPVIILNLANPEIFKWEDHTWKSGRFRFVYHGTIAHRLGVDRVVEALADLPENIVFRLIGEGDYKFKVLELIAKYNLSHRIELYPFVPVEKLPELLHECHAGIIPSRKTEATDKAMLPVKLLEYCNVGLPSIAAELSNIKRYFDDEVVFFDPGSTEDLRKKMLCLYSDGELRSSITDKLRNFLQNNSWYENQKIYCSLIETD